MWYAICKEQKQLSNRKSFAHSDTTLKNVIFIRIELYRWRFYLFSFDWVCFLWPLPWDTLYSIIFHCIYQQCYTLDKQTAKCRYSHRFNHKRFFTHNDIVIVIVIMFLIIYEYEYGHLYIYKIEVLPPHPKTISFTTLNIVYEYAIHDCTTKCVITWQTKIFCEWIIWMQWKHFRFDNHHDLKKTKVPGLRCCVYILMGKWTLFFCTNSVNSF